MIDTEVEKFTAENAVEAGLVDAVKSGAAKVTGAYEMTKDGFIEFKQKTFTFTDKRGNLRFGKFDGDEEIVKFWEMFKCES